MVSSKRKPNEDSSCRTFLFFFLLKIQFVSLAICLSLSATVILLCLFAPKLYIVLFNPSKNIHSKFKTNFNNKQNSSKVSTFRQSQGDGLIVKPIENHRTNHSSTDFPTEISFCQTKANHLPASSFDEGTQTDKKQTQLVLSGKNQSDGQHHVSTSILSNENPWKKLANVRYKMDVEEQQIQKKNDRNKPKIYAQHITFV